MKKGSTFLLRGAIFIIGLAALSICIFILPIGIREEGIKSFFFPIILGIYLSAIPFFIALFQALLLLNYIDKNDAFSGLSINALKYIKYCAIAISIIYICLLPFLFPIADSDDSPGLIGLPIIVIFGSSVVAVVSAVLHKLLQNVIDIKSENDLTV